MIDILDVKFERWRRAARACGRKNAECFATLHPQPFSEGAVQDAVAEQLLQGAEAHRAAEPLIGRDGVNRLANDCAEAFIDRLVEIAYSAHGEGHA